MNVMNPRQEYPRPQLKRPEWLNLNGEWEFEIDCGGSGVERRFFEREHLNGKIVVPFAPESKLSGVENIDFMPSVWYRRDVTVPEGWRGGRVLLHFGAVDYAADVWINGKHAGAHKGGYTPFTFDITRLLNSGVNSVWVNARDDVKNPLQPSGKQCFAYNNIGCMYTRSTGIWQTVWLEHVPEIYITSLKLTPDVDNNKLWIDAELSGYAGGQTFSAIAFLNGREAARGEAKATGRHAAVSLNIDDPVLWNPGAPVLYDLKLAIGSDAVDSYFGMRKIEIEGKKVLFNGKPIFQRLVLDQGYYPDGIYTAPDESDMKKDIELSMRAGFNGARMHMKIFEPLYLYWADKLGYILWGEYPNWGLDDADPRALLSILPEWLEELRRDYSHPAIIGWCPFNETKRERVADTFKTVYNVTKAFDSTRPVIDTSGYVHAITDIYDVHDYDQDPKTFAARYASLETGEGDVYRNHPDIENYNGQPYFVSEFGGTWWNIKRECGGWGYGASPENLEDFYIRFDGLVTALLENPAVCAFCYTQFSDVMQEQNGIFTFDRRPKFDLARIRSILTKPAAIEKQ